MPPLDDYALRPQDLKQGVLGLQKRQRKLTWFAVTSTALCLASAIFLFFAQDVVYSFFGLSMSVQQLHVPMSLDADLAQLNDHSDYFFNLIAWFGWLFLKLIVSFIAAFIVLRILKKFRYFARRFQSFILRFVAWLIAFILLWTGLTAWQYDMKNDQRERMQEAVYYQRSIQESEIAQALVDSSAPNTVKNYVLAQTALLQKKPDLATAKAYVAQLIDAEQREPQFAQYGFQAEQLWTMQQQVYAKSLTPMANSVMPQAKQAETITQLVYWATIAVCIALALLSGLLWVLSHFMQAKLNRIGQRLQP